MKEDNNFVSRVKRYSKVTTSLTSLATQFAGKKYLNFDLSDQKYAAQITEILGNLKGPLMKVAQLSATIPDLLPEEYARKLAELQSNAPPMSWVFESGEEREAQEEAFRRVRRQPPCLRGALSFEATLLGWAEELSEEVACCRSENNEPHP